MALFLVKNTSAPNVHQSNALVVAAETAADARVFAASHFNGDASWTDATVVALTEETLDASASQLGYVWQIIVTGAAGQTADPIVVSVTGTGTDDLDAIAALLVTALNATEIDGAAYAAPNLTVAATPTDDFGDATVIVKVTPPSGNTNADLESIFVVGITHEGAAAAALTVELPADTEAKPEVLDDTLKS